MHSYNIKTIKNILVKRGILIQGPRAGSKTLEMLDQDPYVMNWYGFATLLSAFYGKPLKCFEITLWLMHKVLIYIEHHSVCPLVGIGTPPPL
jgi:hypothetical protein